MSCRRTRGTSRRIWKSFLDSWWTCYDRKILLFEGSNEKIEHVAQLPRTSVEEHFGTRRQRIDTCFDCFKTLFIGNRVRSPSTRGSDQTGNPQAIALDTRVIFMRPCYRRSSEIVVKLDGMTRSYSDFPNDDIGCRSSEVCRNTSHSHWFVLFRMRGEWVPGSEWLFSCSLIGQTFNAGLMSLPDKQARPHLRHDAHSRQRCDQQYWSYTRTSGFVE